MSEIRIYWLLLAATMVFASVVLGVNKPQSGLWLVLWHLCDEAFWVCGSAMATLGYLMFRDRRRR